MNEIFDAIVVGNGLVGKMAALGMAARDKSVALVGPAAGQVRGAPDYALGRSSLEWLETIEIAPKEFCPVRRMRVLSAAGNEISFHAAAAGFDAVCTIVSHVSLDSRASQALRDCPNIAAINATLERLDCGADECRVALSDGKAASAPLLVGADGIRSKTAAAAKMPGTVHEYGHSAVVARLEVGCAHPHTAWQWFGASDVLAFLPIGGAAVSMIWSLPASDASQLSDLSPAEFAKAVERRTNGRLGGIRALSDPAVRPLAAARRERIAAGRIALAGDSARGIHPLAGMGLNLGMGDCAALARLCGGKAADVPAALRRYSRDRSRGTFPVEIAIGAMASRLVQPSAAKIAAESLLFGSAQRGALLRAAIARAANSALGGSALL